MSEEEILQFESDESCDGETIEKENIPEIGDVDWHDYVLSQFSEDELYEGKFPTLKGLRRVSHQLLGPLKASRIVKMDSLLDPNHFGRACCVYELEYMGGYVFAGSADAYSGNVNGSYGCYVVALAENRAEARAYRKALMINVVTADEMTGSEKNEFINILSGEYKEDDLVSSTQKALIDSKVKQLGINLEKFYDKFTFSTEKTTKTEAKDIIKTLNSYQQDISSIPQEIK